MRVRSVFILLGMAVVFFTVAVILGCRIALGRRGIFAMCCVFPMAIVLGRPFCRFGAALGQAVRHHLDFFTRGGQTDLGGANGIFAVAPVGQGQRLFVGINRSGVFCAFGQHAQGGQANQALRAQIFFFFIGSLQIRQRGATGKPGFHRVELVGLGSGSLHLFAHGFHFFGGSLSSLLSLFNLGRGLLGCLGQLFDGRLAALGLFPRQIAKRRSAGHSQRQDNFQHGAFHRISFTSGAGDRCAYAANLNDILLYRHVGRELDGRHELGRPPLRPAPRRLAASAGAPG